LTLLRSRSGMCCLFFLIAATALFAEETTTSAAMELRSLPLVRVMVNGKGPFTFGIDTGTGGDAVVSAELIGQLGLPVTGKTQVGDPSGRNGRTVRVVRITSISFAGVEFKDIEATEFPGPVSDHIDGILGFVLFREFLFTLDYPNRQVRLERGSLPAADGDQVLPFRMPDNVPCIALRIGGEKIEVHVDSGRRGLGLPEKFAQNLQFVSTPMVIGRGRTVSNDFEIKGAQLASDIHLGGYTFSRPFVAIDPLFPVANFGSAALRNFAVTFDQKNKLVRLHAADRTIVIEGPRSHEPQLQVRPAPGPEPAPSTSR
jgi:Aspartyl protease